MKFHLRFDFAAFGRPLRFQEPVGVLAAYQLRDVLPVLRRVQDAVARGHYAAGFVAYEAAPAFDPAMAVPPVGELPLVWFGLFAAPVRRRDQPEADLPFRFGEWRSGTDDARYRRDVEAIREGIADGDYYQVNYTMRLRAPFEGDAYAAYRKLSDSQRAPYSAFLDLGSHQILSLSPELFFRIEPQAGDDAGAVVPPGASASRRAPADGSVGLGPAGSRGGASARRIVTRPMKGTHRRGRWTDEDLAFHERLRSSPKELAENLMIVDLIRNDLGRIAETGSVRVDELFSVERYPTLLQMTSTISADLRNDVDIPEILAALFPCGSVTGAPKIAVMRRIADLERESRGVYCGAIGVMEPGGRATFSVAIRTLVLNRETGVAEYGVGSGITWGSCADAEAVETRLKAALLDVPEPRPDLFETLRLRDGEYARAECHLRRLIDSAGYFGIPADSEHLRSSLVAEAQRRPGGLWRVRLRLSRDGVVSVESEPLSGPIDLDGDGAPNHLLPPARRSTALACAAAREADAGRAAAGALTFAWAADPIDRNDRLLFHKVADRSLYTSRKAARPDVYDVLLWNREGEPTEFTTGNLVVELDGDLVTPPLDCGLLPGVLRSELIEARTIHERVLRPEDLRRASRVWLINSLRGWVAMRCNGSPFH